MSGEISSYDGRGFCPRCGSRLLDTADPGDTLIEIRIGSLDEAPFELKPEAEIWVKRRESWIPPVEGRRYALLSARVRSRLETSERSPSPSP